jgi:hypothetical protein
VEEVEKDTYLKTSALSAADVLRAMERGGCFLNFVILDACRSKPSRMVRSTRAELAGFSEMRAPSGSVIAFACAPGCTALDGNGRNGLFTKHLLQHMTTPGLDVDIMLRRITLGVKQESNSLQDPFHNHNLSAEHVSLCEAVDAAKAAQLTPISAATDNTALVAFLARCKLDKEVGELLPLLHALGVDDDDDLEYLTDETVHKISSLRDVSRQKLLKGLQQRRGAPTTVAKPAQQLGSAVDAALVDISAAEAAGDMVRLVTMLKTFEAEATVAMRACSAMVAACSTASNRDALGSAGALEVVLHVMKQQPSRADVQLQCSRTLSILSNKHADNAARAFRAGSLEPLLAAMKTHTTQTEMQAQCLLALKNIVTGQSASRDAACAAGALETAVASLRACTSHASTALNACHVFVELAVSDTNEKRAVDAGAIDAVVAAMRAHKSNAAVLHVGCWALHTMGFRVDSKLRSGTAGAIEVVISALRDNPTDSAVQEYGCRALDVITNNDANRNKAAAAGAVDVLLATLKAYPSNPKVALATLSAMRYMVSGTTQLHAKALSGGLIEATVASMRTFSADVKLQETACSMLLNLCANDFNNADAKCVGAGAVEAVVAAMKQHTSQLVIQEKGCWALRYMLDSVDNALRAKADAAGAVDAVLAAVRANPTNAADVHLQAWWAIRQLAINDATESKAVQSGAMELAIAALQTYSSNAGVVVAAAAALRTISIQPAHRPRVLNAGGVDAVLAAMRAFPTNADIQMSGSILVRNVTTDVAAVPVMVSKGVVEVLITALRSHSANVNVSEWVCRSLWNMSTDRQCAEKLYANGVTDLMVATMRTHTGSAPLQQAGLRVLKACAESKSASEKFSLASKGVIDVAVAAMRAAPKDAVMQEYGGNLLWSMSVTLNVPLMGTTGALDVALAAMREHARSDVVLQGCMAVLSVAFDVGSSTPKMSTDVATLTVAAMKANSSHKLIGTYGCTIIKRLAAEDAAIRTAASKAGAVEAVVAVMRVQVSDASTQEEACSAIVNLTSNHQVRARHRSRADLYSASQSRPWAVLAVCVCACLLATTLLTVRLSPLQRNTINHLLR